MSSSVVSPAAGAPAPTAEQRKLFFHLYWDVAWFGLFAGSTQAFIAIYVTRLGADSWQIGLLNAGPALVGLLFTLPAGRWLHNRPIGPAVFNSALLSRAPYLLWVLIPLLLAPQSQIWTYIILALLMTIPGAILMVGFNALYAAAVPPEHRGAVAGRRNAMLAVVYVLTSIACGAILSNLPQTIGYTIVFAVGFVGVAMSTVHVWYLRKLRGDEGIDPSTVRTPLGDDARPGAMRTSSLDQRPSVAPRVFARGLRLLRPDIMSGPYGQLIFSLFLFHFAQFVPIALFPIFWVQDLHFTDQQISLGSAIFQAVVLVGSLQLGRLTLRFGNYRLLVTGLVGLSLYPLVIAYTQELTLYIVASILGGAAWSVVGGALGNYLLDIAPAHDRPGHLAWYNMALNAGILLGSMAGPIIASQIGVADGILAGFVLRLAAAGTVWWAGRNVNAALKRSATQQPFA